MNADLDHLVREAMSLTGAAAPAVSEENAPVLNQSVLVPASDDPLYLIGLIGGKDVGKSSLVNALVGRSITRRSSHGAGTESVIAYVHHSREGELRSLLESEAPGRFTIVTHDMAHLGRQVLVDLPDIDSHYAGHVELTRKMLRHMLYPVWMQSIEKYADLAPQKLLAQVASGNDPSNFIFVLNKADQLDRSPTDASAADELREDFASRIARTLSLPHPPRVRLVSALAPDRFELPALREALSMQRSAEEVEQSRQLASRRRALSIARWLDEQDLPDRAQRLARLEESARQALLARLGEPLLDEALPRLSDDPAQRLAMVEAVMNVRVARWPIVNIAHALLSPLLSLLRRSLAAPVHADALRGADRLVAQHLDPLNHARGLASLVQSAFAQLQQSDPSVSALYRHRRLWIEMDAALAADDLRSRLSATIERQRDAVLRRLAGRGIWGAPFRWTLSLGAILWFPLVQPLLEAVLVHGREHVVQNLALLLVRILGVTYLLKNASFLLLYFAALWLLVRWNTQRRVQKLMLRWRRDESRDPSMSLSRQVMEWIDDLLSPIRIHRERIESVRDQGEALAKRLDLSRDAA